MKCPRGVDGGNEPTYGRQRLLQRHRGLDDYPTIESLLETVETGLECGDLIGVGG
jgi:hypothetical protein